MMKHLVSGLLGAAMFAAFPLHAIDADQAMPAIDAAKWYTRTMSVPAKGLAAVILLDITSDDAVNTLRMLENLDAADGT